MIKSRLQGAFNIRPGEGWMVSLVLAYAILLFSSNVLAITGSLGLFFEVYDAETLPYTYVLLMFVGPLISLLYLRLNSILSLSKALLSVHIFLLLSLILLPLLLSWSAASVLRFLLPVYLEINVSLTFASFWNLLGRLYNLRQGKRLFPLLSSGEHLATIGAGFITTLFVARFDTINLYWISALFMGGAIALLVVINRNNGVKMEEISAEDVEQTSSSNLRMLIKEPYVRLLFAMVVLYTISIVMVENLSFMQAEIRFPTARGMATYIGIFMAIFGVLGLLVQWLLAGRALDRFGVIATILALPGGLLLFMAAFALLGSFNGGAVALFWLASSANMYAYILDAPYISAGNVILQPLPAHLRTQAQTTATGVAYPLATGLSGLLLLFLLTVLNFDSVQLSYGILVVLILWVLVGKRLGRAYARRLWQALQARSLGDVGLFQSPDRTSILVLEEALSGPQPGAVLYALEILAEVAPEVLPARLSGLLAYPDDAVKKAALGHIAKATWQEAPIGVVKLLEDSPNPDIRAAALRTWYSIGQQLPSTELVQLREDLQQPVRQAALAIMCLQDDPATRRLATAMLNDLVESTEVVKRVLAANIIGEAGAEGGEDALLLKLLHDDDPGVLRAALAATTQTCFPATWPAIIPALADNLTRPLAVDALAVGGEDVLLLLQRACLVPDQDARIVAGIAQVCSRISGWKANVILESLLDHENATVRREALLGLSHSTLQELPLQVEAVEERLLAQAAELAEVVAAQVDIGEADQVRLTADALESRRQLETDNLLLLLSLLTETQMVLWARQALRPDHVDDEKRAYALEALDILLDHEHKALLFPFLGQLRPAQRLAEIQQRFPQSLLGQEERLRVLVGANTRTSERWTRICAIYTAGLLEHRELAKDITAAAVHYVDDPLLVETALNSLAQLGVSLEAIGAAHPLLAKPVIAWQARDPLEMILLQKAESLKQAGIFADLPNDVLEAMARLMDVIAVNAGETIIIKGDLGDCLYVVVEGELRVHDGDRIFTLLAPGSVIGEMALLDAEPRSASVTATSHSRLLQLDQEPFYELLVTNPRVLRALLSLLSRRLRQRTTDLVSWPRQEVAQPVRPVTGGQLGVRKGIAVPTVLRDWDRLLILKSIDYFAGIDDTLLGKVAVLLDEVDLAGGEVLFQEGNPGYSLYIVAVGQVRVHAGERTLAYVGKGGVLGEMALLEAAPRSASVTAVVPTQLLRLDQQPFFELLEVQPEMARGLIKMISGRLRAVLQNLAMQPETQ